MTFKPIDPRRDSFRQYLERSGVIESLTKSFVKLLDVQQRPDNPMDFVRTNLGDSLIERDQIAELQQELNDAQNEIRQLRIKLSQYEAGELDKQSNAKISNSSIDTTADECSNSSDNSIVIKSEDE